VHAGIDLGLWLAGEIAGKEHAETIQLYIEYDPQPPFRRRPPEQGEQDRSRQRENTRPEDRAQPLRSARDPDDRMATSTERVPQAQGLVMNGTA
jgi:hypothetical protein